MVCIQNTQDDKVIAAQGKFNIIMSDNINRFLHLEYHHSSENSDAEKKNISEFVQEKVQNSPSSQFQLLMQELILYSCDFDSLEAEIEQEETKKTETKNKLKKEDSKNQEEEQSIQNQDITKDKSKF